MSLAETSDSNSAATTSAFPLSAASTLPSHDGFWADHVEANEAGKKASGADENQSQTSLDEQSEIERLKRTIAGLQRYQSSMISWINGPFACYKAAVNGHFAQNPLRDDPMFQLIPPPCGKPQHHHQQHPQQQHHHQQQQHQQQQHHHQRPFGAPHQQHQQQHHHQRPFGAPHQPVSTFGAPQQQGGFGAPQQQSGFNAPRQTGFNTTPQSGFGAQHTVFGECKYGTNCTRSGCRYSHPHR